MIVLTADERAKMVAYLRQQELTHKNVYSKRPTILFETYTSRALAGAADVMEQEAPAPASRPTTAG